MAIAEVGIVAVEEVDKPATYARLFFLKTKLTRSRIVEALVTWLEIAIKVGA